MGLHNIVFTPAPSDTKSFNNVIVNFATCTLIVYIIEHTYTSTQYKNCTQSYNMCDVYQLFMEHGIRPLQ